MRRGSLRLRLFAASVANALYAQAEGNQKARSAPPIIGNAVHVKPIATGKIEDAPPNGLAALNLRPSLHCEPFGTWSVSQRMRRVLRGPTLCDAAESLPSYIRPRDNANEAPTGAASKANPAPQIQRNASRPSYELSHANAVSNIPRGFSGYAMQHRRAFRAQSCGV